MNTNIKNINLKDLLEYMGEEVISHGRQRYKLKNKDSLILKDSVFIWNSKMIKGNYYTLLNSLYGMNSKEIYIKVNEFLKDIENNIFIPSEKLVKSEKTNYGEQKKYKKDNLEYVKKYLSEKRKIDEKIIESLYVNNTIFLDTKNNINFVIKDVNENIKGHDTHGTTEKRFKQNLSEYGFNITKKVNNEEIKKIFVFEASIDLISFLELKKDEIKELNENIRFLSMSGLREDILKNYMQDIEKLVICTDNDAAGNNFYDLIKEKYKFLNLYRELPNNKDWNEDLLMKKENNLEHIKKNIKEKELER